MERHFGYKNGVFDGILRSIMSCHRLASYGERQEMETMSRILATLLGEKNNHPSLLFRLVRVANLMLYVLTPALVAAIELSDIPMITRIHPPPANIMFVLDDSSSMNFDILVHGGYDGSFPTPFTPSGRRGFCYLFDDVGDNVYKFSSHPDWYAGHEGRKYWKSQWYSVNVMYYNPNMKYAPWPDYGRTIFTDANKDRPKSHPVNNEGYYLDLDGISLTIDGLNIPHCHYYVFSAAANRPYLVILSRAQSSITYYSVTVSGSGLAERVSGLSLDDAPPSDVVTGRTYDEERQNFANWFTYYRRREFATQNALATVLRNMAEVRIGIYGINRRIVCPLASIRVSEQTAMIDETDLVIDKIYRYQSEGSTPLKEALNTVGRYYSENSGAIGGTTGPKPYGTQAEGAGCQQSFAAVLTDGYYSDLSYRPSYVGNADGDDGAPYADNYSHSLADIAMFYYENDLSVLPNLVPVNKLDRSPHQHMSTYAIAFGVNGSLDPSEYDATLRHKTTGQAVAWPEVNIERSPQTIDDLWHATVNGRGKFIRADSPQELVHTINELIEATSEIAIGSASPVTINGNSLYGKVRSNTYVYQASYSNKNNEWTGDLRAFRLDQINGDIIANPIKWSAAEALAEKEWSQRLVTTYNGTEGIPFSADSLTDDQRRALGANPDNMVKYVRGGNVSGWRLRSKKLGDFVNSSPVFEDGVVYCGANDGMLHAFDAETGHELFAHVPGLVFENLHFLADPGYTHKFYVDLTPSVKKGDGVLGGVGQKSLLVGGLGKGGKGYFGLDITVAKTISSEAELARRVLWEFPKTADPDMGYSFSKPLIVKSNSTLYPWVVIFGNGYNSEGGKSVLYVINPSTGGLIKKIDADPGPDNGLSSPVGIDVTYDGRVDFIYAGDLHGKLWKFDLSDRSIDQWKVAYGSNLDPQPLFQAKGPAGSIQPITTRPDVMDHPEQHGFIVGFGTGKYLGDSDHGDTSVQSVYGIWDYGDRVYNLKSKRWSDDDNREYVGSFNRGAFPQLSNQPMKATLLRQKQKLATVLSGGIEYRMRLLSGEKPVWATQSDPDHATRQKPNPSDSADNDVGYYFDLNPGERVISDVYIRDGRLLAIGFTPNTDPCGPGGNSILMEVNAFTGGSSEGALFDISGDGEINAKDLVKFDFDEDGISEEMAVAGIEYMGSLQPPSIIQIGNSTKNPLEKKYMSSSTGRIEQLIEKGPKLGVTYWMEIHF
jgi:type IV pilus assembly protein PilY1